MVLIPRFNITLSKANLDSAILDSFHELRIRDPSIDQIDSVRNFVIGKDVLVCLPTGAGKSFCYAVLPVVFDKIVGKTKKSIAIIVSPLKALIKDQIRRFRYVGIKCGCVGVDLHVDREEDHILLLKTGGYQLLYTTPETLINSPSWREMIRSDIYTTNLVAYVVDEAHCIDEW